PIKWGSVIFFPCGFYKFTGAVEEFLPVMKNPFGAFLGLSFPVTFRYKTIQDVIMKPFKIKGKSGYPVGGVVRKEKK
ncbi:MAG: hypothetical protein Q7J12_04495, partial [Syntrophales bacterium]|nr:hypothetical protein [Syntrophales bacterium]